MQRAAQPSGQYLQLLLQLLFRQQKGVFHQVTNDLVHISAMEANLCELGRLDLHKQHCCKSIILITDSMILDMALFLASVAPVVMQARSA